MAATDVLTGIAMLEPLLAEPFWVVPGLGIRLGLGPNELIDTGLVLDSGAAERLADEERENTVTEESDARELTSDEDETDDDAEDRVIDVATPSFDPISNRLMALSPEQQLRLR